MLLKGKRGLIIGVANDKSIAYGIAKECHENGAQLVFTYLNDALKKRVEPIAKEFNSSNIYELDITNEQNLKQVLNSIKDDCGNLDFILHAVAFAPKQALTGDFIDTTYQDFEVCMKTSVFSFISLCKEVLPLMNEGGSILTLTYLGGERFIPNYNVMGVAKAALESSVRYLSCSLGKKNIRVNAISAGPIKTLAACGIDDFRKILLYNKKNSPLQRNVSAQDVGKSALYFFSDLSSGVTAEVHYVDCGYNIMGMLNVEID